MSLLCFWFFLVGWVFASPSPTLVWESKTVAPQRWQGKQIEGLLVFGINQGAVSGAVPLYLEARSIDGKPHTLRIECEQSNQVVLRARYTVTGTERQSWSMIVPIQSEEGYGGVSCDLHQQENYLTNFYRALSRIDYNEVEPVLFIDSEQSAIFHPEWMIATTNHRKEGVFTQVREINWLPTKSLGYMGTRTVVWFSNERRLSSLQESALFEWVIQGGHLIVVGEPTFDDPTLWNAYIDQRFSILTPELWSKEIDLMQREWEALDATWSNLEREQFQQVAQLEFTQQDTVASYQAGRGRLSMVADPISVQTTYTLLEMPQANQTGFFATFQSLSGPNVDSTVNTVKSRQENPFFNDYKFPMFIKDLELFTLVPISLLIVLLVGFTILVGPVNLLWKGNRLNWVWRAPFIALLCTLVVLAVNWANTRGDRGQSVSFMTWDARTNDLWARQERIYFANRSGLETVEVTSTSQHLPLRPTEENLAWLSITEDGAQWERFSKKRQVHPVWSWHHLTQRRGIRIENGTVYNDLEATIDRLVYRDKDGQYWQTSTSVAGNQSAALTPTSLNEIGNLHLWSSHPQWLWHIARTEAWGSLPLHTALMVFTEPVVWDDLTATNGQFDNIDAAISDVHTVLYGVLP